MDIALDKRERILNTAAELLLKTGLQTPMSAIAEQANVATGSLYNYFPSKEDLVFAVYQRVAAELNADMIVEIDQETPFPARVEAYIMRYIEHLWRDQTRAMLYEVITNSPLIMQERVGSLFLEFAIYSIKVFSEPPENGEPEMPKSLMASFVRGAIRNTLKRLRAAGGELTPDLKHRIVVMCWAAITA
ncbi:TetR/AcrR family transcriptional regulator [Rhizobium mayense]|uniref:TetR/AcrR family transcriptional regulator n=1 Tax=Rhizobium mayense TaxID=1312184 RepID=A0ABT7K376_9HYPH|nr:TetR/AcrR family transcriptional regulator [Rhizobium mayense]MDL2401873.1 TetR/AcrR family transcriptional regulator [Rhizobium mayense]